MYPGVVPLSRDLRRSPRTALAVFIETNIARASAALLQSSVIIIASISPILSSWVRLSLWANTNGTYYWGPLF